MRKSVDILTQANTVAILVALYESKEPSTVTALWQSVGSNYYTIKNQCKKLEGKGLLSVMENGRMTYVELTPVGVAVAKLLLQAADKYDSLYKPEWTYSTIFVDIRQRISWSFLKESSIIVENG